jgi:hypothetical protein
MKRSAILGALVLACSSPPDAPRDAAPEACDFAFDPEPDLEGITVAAAERWSAATGCNVHVAAGGAAIVAWPSMYGTVLPDGSLSIDQHVGDRRMCGAWDPATSTMYVAPCSRPLAFSVGHEMGHALGLLTHSASGIMAETVAQASDVIDDASLALVCSALECPAFAPEAS